MTNREKAGPIAWREKLEYVRLTRAADLIGCTVDELLHLGAIGEATFLAPVVAEGDYEWPVSETGEKSWDNPFVEKFDRSDRVILHRRDVAKIEAVGWVIPWLFFSPNVAREVAKNSFSSNGIEELSKTLALMEERAGIVPWYAVETGLEALRDNLMPRIKDTKENRTTVEHLFLSLVEVKRLQENVPQDSAAEQRKDISPQEKQPIHGNVLANEAKASEMLAAAIAFRLAYPEKCKDGTSWAETVMDFSVFIWGEDGEPPRKSRWLKEQLNKIIQESLKLKDWKPASLDGRKIIKEFDD